MANTVQRNIHHRAAPFYSLHALGKAGKRFKERHQHSLLILDGPAELFEHGVKVTASKGHELCKQHILYYQEACALTSEEWEHFLVYMSDAAMNMPHRIEQCVQWTKSRLAQHPKSKIASWVIVQIKRYEACDELEFVQATAKKTESILLKICHIDPTEFSSAGVLLLQDLHDITAEVQPFLKGRKKIARWIDDFPNTVTKKVYSYPARKHTAFSKYTSPVIEKIVTKHIIPKEEFQEWFSKMSQMSSAVVDSVETATVHTLIPEGVNKVAPKVGWFAGRHAFKYMICNYTGWAFAYTIQYSQSYLLGYEEEDLISHEMLVTTHTIAKWAIWTWMLNQEVREWKKEREQAPNKLREKIGELASKTRKDVEDLKSEKGYIEEFCSEAMSIVAESVHGERVEHTSPPEHTIWWPIWEVGKSYLTTGWQKIASLMKTYLSHSHQD